MALPIAKPALHEINRLPGAALYLFIESPARAGLVTHEGYQLLDV